MTTFPYTPKSATLEVAPNLYSAKFGDGYEQAAPQGINYLPQKWSLVFNSNVSNVKTFLETLGGYQSFHWTPPNASSPLAFVCKSWSEQDTPGGVRTLNCTFEQRFVDSYTSTSDTGVSPSLPSPPPPSTLDGSVRYDQSQALNPSQQSIARSNLGLALVASTGSYADLVNTPSIPTLISELTNDIGYLTGITSAQVKAALGITILSGANTGDETVSTILGKLGLSTLSGSNTGDETSATIISKLGYTPESINSKGAANGYAPLGSDSKIPSAYLPSYVDDVLEFASYAALPTSGETGKIYVTTDTNYEYRWSGSIYIRLVSSPGTTDALAEGATNKYFTTARAQSAISVSGSLSYANGVISYTTPTQVSAFSNDAGYLTGITSAQVKTALGISTLSGSNTGDETQATIISKLGFTPYNASNPAGYLTSITSAQIAAALGFTPYSSSNPNGYLTGISSAQVVAALGFTPTTLAAVASVGYATGGGTASGTNTGDETATTIRTKLGITTLSGSNTGDETAGTILNKLGITTISGNNSGDETTASIVSKLASATVISDSSGKLRSVPQNAQTAAYVLVASDNGKHIAITSGGVTVPANTFAAGDVVTIVNNSSLSQTITSASGLTLQWAGQTTSTTGNRTLGLYGIATILFLSSTFAIISGAGLS